MTSTSEKFFFLLIVVAAITLARFLYPGIPALPSLADVTDPTAASSTASAPPLLSLPQTAVASADAAGGAPDAMTNTASTPVNSVFTRVTNTPVPQFLNEAYLVGDITTSAVLAGSNIDTRWPTASLTKLMTATLIVDQLPTSTTITITPQMFAVDPEELTLTVGGTYTVEDLLHVMLMPSSNVAAEAMAETIGHDKFMAEMNDRAKTWGMLNTHFDDTSGISAGNQSTAHDLMTLAVHVYDQYPQILAITDTHQISITNLANGRRALVTSINNYAGEPEFVGGKTGHTNQAGDNLLSIFSYHGHPFITIVLNVSDRFGDTTKLYNWFREDFK